MYYFDDVNKQNELKKVLDEWIGTPFRHRVAVKNLGCDCIHFVGAVLHEMGILDFSKVKIPDYAPDWHLHHTRQLLLEEINKAIKVERVSLSKLRNGDIVLSHFGKAASHASIYFGGQLYHALNNIGVVNEEIHNSAVSKNLKYALRLLK